MANYPLPWGEDDCRMTQELIREVRVVLVKHGYPELTQVDLMTLRVALVRFVYGQRDKVTIVYHG